MSSVRVAGVVVVTALAGISGWPLLSVIVGSTAIVTSMLAAGTGSVAALTVATRRTRRSGATVTAVGLVVVVGCAATATVAARPSGVGVLRSLGDLPDALIHGWAALATTPTPVDADPRLLVPIAVAASAAASGGSAVLLLRPTAPLAPVLPGLAAVLAAAIAAGGTGGSPILLGATVAALVGIHLVLRRLPDEPTSTSVAQTALAVTVTTVLAGTVAFAAPTFALATEREPFDPRDHLTPPVTIVGATDPLDLVASLRRNPAEVLAVVDADGAAPVRLVSLDRFDGARWTASGTFRSFGRPIDRADRSGVSTRRVELTVTIVGLPGPWLPAVDDPVEFRGVDALVDPASGTFVATGDVAAGESYTVISEIPEPDVGELRSGLPIDDGGPVGLPDGLPTELADLAAELTVNAPSAFDEAILLSDHLARTIRSDRSLPGGTSYGQLRHLLADSGVGNDAQIASAFAVLGRAAGLPTRVVVGFDPAAVPEGGGFELRAGDLRVWPEVAFDDVGWVPFRLSDDDEAGGGNVLVGFGGDQTVVVTEPAPAPPTEVPAPPAVIAADDLPTLPDLDAIDDESASSPSPLLVALSIAGVLVVATSLAAGCIVWLKRRRTARRRSGTALDAVLGGWDDVLDRLHESGAAPADLVTSTIEDIVERDPDVAPILAGLYVPVQTALYGDEPLTATDVDRVWRSRQRLVERLRETAPWPERVRRCVDPRPLRTARSDAPRSSTSERRRTRA